MEHLGPNVWLNCGPLSLTHLTACSLPCAAPALLYPDALLPPALLHPDSLMRTTLRLRRCFAPKCRKLGYLGICMPCGSALSWLGQVCGSLDPLTLIGTTHSQASPSRIRLKLGLCLKSYPSVCFFFPLPVLLPPLSWQFLKGEIIWIKYLCTNIMPGSASGGPNLTHALFLQVPAIG